MQSEIVIFVIVQQEWYTFKMEELQNFAELCQTQIYEVKYNIKGM